VIIPTAATPAGSKTYILRSILDPIIIEYAALTDETILELESNEAPEDEDESSQLRNFGSIISWSGSDQLGSIGILYVILALILVNGRSMAESECHLCLKFMNLDSRRPTEISDDLRAVLKQLRLTPNERIPLDNKSTNKAMQTNNYLTLLQKQGYLERSVIGEQKAGGKRTRIPAATQGGADGNSEDVNNIQWKWGGRAHSEVGEQGIAKFIAEFMVERMIESKEEGDGDDDDEGAQGKQKNDDLQQKRLGVMMNGIQRAAGGDLSDVK
jgi:melanoma-associated antigen